MMPATRPLPLHPFKHHARFLTLLTALVLAACGGGSAVGPATPTGMPGELQKAEAVNTLDAASIGKAAQQADSWFYGLAPRYAVKSYRLNYITTDADGNKVLASGLVSVPVKPDGALSPMLSYQHATNFRNADAPSQKVLASEPPAQLSAQGYIVVAADYVGFGASHGKPHPYMEATPTARAVIDMLQATRSWQQQNRISDNGQLFLMGYSEGGYASMAAHRLIQQTGGETLARLQGAVPGAGPYDVQAALDGLLARISADYPELAGLITSRNLSKLDATTRKRLRELMLLYVSHSNEADVSFRVDGIDRYLADDMQGLAMHNSVHAGWAPTAPVYLFHGQADKTVPYAASTSALQALQQGAPAVTLTSCTVPNPDHIPCVPEYLRFALGKLGALARNL